MRSEAIEAETGLVGVIRRAYLPERRIPTGLGYTAVKVEEIAEGQREGGLNLTVSLPSYLELAQSIE